MPLPILQGVFLYLYVASATNQLPRNKMILYLHFIPTLIAYAYLVRFFRLPAEEKLYVYQNNGLGYEGFMILKYYAYSIIGIGYIIWSLFLLKNHRKNIVKQYSNIGKVDLNWLRILVWGMGVIWLVVIFMNSEFYHFVSIVLFVFIVCLFGVKQIAIEPQLVDIESDEHKEAKKYLKSGLSEDQSKAHYEQLIRLMTDEKIFTRSELLIRDLANMLEIHPNHLSQIINENNGSNFYDFVNYYRIQEFKALVASSKNEKFTFLSLAFDCGFNSKSSFNRCFKKIEGITPSQYIEQLTVNNI